jgi:hypothetical protein
MEKISISGHVTVQEKDGKPVAYWSHLKNKFFVQIEELRLHEVLMSRGQCEEVAPKHAELGWNTLRTAKVTIEIQI